MNSKINLLIEVFKILCFKYEMNNYVFVVDGFMAPFILMNKLHIIYRGFFIKSRRL